jgi:hypothetical protein
VSRIHKYPRTHHLEGSRLQPGDEDLDSVPFRELRDHYLVIEEKCDGANAGISFDAGGRLWLQSRGHFLTGGAREKHFNLFKQWAHGHADALRGALADRYVLYGEWLHAKHTVFYDRLPQYFLEFDVLDTQTGAFLSTDSRRELLRGLPVASVPVLWSGRGIDREGLVALVGRSLYKGPDWRERLLATAAAKGLDAERVWRETDPSDLMEGLYVKAEEPGERVVDRYKYVRADFLTRVLDSGTHWLKRPLVPNLLASGAADGGGAP